MFSELLLTFGVVGVASVAYIFYRLSENNARYFGKRNLKCTGIKENLKNLFALLLGKTDILTLVEKFYNTFPDESISGSFDFFVPLYLVRDPEVIKQLAIKDFDYFEDHRVIINEKMDALLGNSLISLRGEKWRQMRATLSPAFTGSKMRLMFELVSECADEIVKHFSKKAESGEKLNIEMKDFFSRYTNDVIATCAFGIKVNSFADPGNAFYTNGKEMLNFVGFLKGLRSTIVILAPKIAKVFNLKIFNQTISESFKNMILDTMTVRQKNNIIRPDMINIMMQVRDGTLKEQIEVNPKEVQDGFATVEEQEMTINRKWNDDEVVAQCLLFFLAGFETSSAILTFVAYELVANPDIQQKLYEEIAEVNNELGGKRITYDALQKMKYLDQVICETLRKWPAAVQTDRICVKDYIYDDGKLKFKIEKGSNLIFSLYGIQRDPKYFPNPDKFDPERFSDENRPSIVPGTYLPFGIGPRNCIGSRFALMELKSILYHLLLKFTFEVNKDTQIPLKIKPGLILVTEKGVHLELKPRNNA